MSRTHRKHSKHHWDDTGDHEDRRASFQQRVRHGEYQSLYDASIRVLIEQGAAIEGIEQELGAVRFALAKLMAEEEDAGKLAIGVARLASATVQLLKVIKPAATDSDEPAIASLNRILIDLERDARAARESGRPTPTIAHHSYPLRYD